MQDTGIQTPVGIKVKGPTIWRPIEELAQTGRRRCSSDFPGTQSVIAERISPGYFIDARSIRERMAQHAGSASTKRMPIVRYAIGGDNVVAHQGRRTRRSCRSASNIRRSISTRWTRSATRRSSIAGGGRSVLSATSPTSPCKKHAGDDPQRQRRRSPATSTCISSAASPAPEYVDRRAAVSREEADAAGRLLGRVDRAIISTRGRALARCASSCRSRWSIIFALLMLAFRSVADSLADHAVGAVRAGRRRASCSGRSATR